MVVPNISIPEFVRRNTGQATSRRTVLWDFSAGEMQTSPDGQILIYSGSTSGRNNLITLENRIRKIFATVRGESVLYPLSFGSDFQLLIGKPPDYVEARILSMISETLSSINLIERVEMSNLQFDKESVTFNIRIFDKQNDSLLIDNLMIPGAFG